jgi:S1-C subfamily serine protease
VRASRFLALILLAIGIRAAAAALGHPQVRSTPRQGARDPKTPTQILDENRDSIAVIVAGGDRSLNLGTGFFVQSKGLLLTNLHVAEGMDLVGVKLPSSGSVVWARYARGFDSDSDLVVLEVETAAAKTARLGDSDEVRVGEPIVVVGNPEGLEQTVSNGLVSAIGELNGRRLFQISAPVSEGSSGSPVFNEYGEVIGVVVGSLQSGQNLNFAVAIN